MVFDELPTKALLLDDVGMRLNDGLYLFLRTAGAEEGFSFIFDQQGKKTEQSFTNIV